MEALSVNLEYHVELDKHDYSVSHNLVHEEVEARITLKTVESFLRGKRVASHLRSTLPHRPTTNDEHMPSSHRRYGDWAHEWIRSEAAKVRADAETLIDVILVATASGTRLPLGHRHSRAGQALRRGTCRRRLRPCAAA
ncbi:Mu transposase domain-containing protein [Bradyrhizobium ottawaense]|uniref:Mu transposase domain-containing protein n=1 Tax=Bradyrhizobium ottawaense TaxID=931866 RepID=UPI003513A17F